MAASLASIGYGTIFAFESGTSPGESPTNYIPIAEVKNIKPPNQQTDLVDVTHNASPLRRREYVAGLIAPGEASFEMNFVAGSPSDVRIQGLQTSGNNVNCRITFMTNEPTQIDGLVNWDFIGLVKGYEITAATADAMVATVTLQVTGSTTVT